MPYSTSDMEYGVWPIGHPFNEMNLDQRRACIQASKMTPEKPIAPDIDRSCTGCGKITNKGQQCTCRKDFVRFALFLLAFQLIGWLAILSTQFFAK